MSAPTAAIARVPSGDLEAQLDRVRLESDTLYAVIAVIAAAPDLAGILDRVVDLLTEATDCHACFIYLRHGDRLRLRAASRVFSHVVGKIEFGVQEGLAGWAVRHGEAAVIRENALADPRTNYIAELQEERFQSMVTVPVAARSGEAIGVIVLHTAAPREFDESTLNFLVHTASLLAGAIENATLYEEARGRVADLQRLSRLSQRIAAVDDREALYDVATAGVRDLLGADSCRLYELDRARGRLLMAAADPPARGDELGRPHGDTAAEGGLAVLLDALGRRDESAPDGERGEDEHRIVAPITAGREQLGALLAMRQAPWEGDAGELLRAVAGQVAVALEKAALIERLTGTNIVHELFARSMPRTWRWPRSAPARRASISAAASSPSVRRRSPPRPPPRAPPGRSWCASRSSRRRCGAWPRRWPAIAAPSSCAHCAPSTTPRRAPSRRSASGSTSSPARPDW